MKFKPDWNDAEQRLTDLWEGRPLDRPCMMVLAPQTGPPPADVYGDRWADQNRGDAPPATAEDRWLSPDWLVPHSLKSMSQTWWGGEAIPSVLLMAGWLNSLGGRPHFDHRTIWFDPFPVDFSKPHPFHHDPLDPWVQRFEQLYQKMTEAAGWDNFLIGAPAILPAHDLLSMHIGTTEFMTALIDHPAWMRQAILDGATELLHARNRLRTITERQHRFWYGNAGWMPFWAPTPYVGTQSDVSCMLSPDHFEEFVMPEIDLLGRDCAAMWYHLDGGDACQHLPRLLSLPYLRVIQYVPTPQEPPNGKAHLPLYRRIQDAGRIVHIQVDKTQVEPLCRALDPNLLVLDVSWSCNNADEGRELLAAARRWTSARAPQAKS